jgi:hypothetical protein
MVRYQQGGVQLASQPAALVGVGCIERHWQGHPELIRARLIRELAQPPEADRLLDPHAFTVIEYDPGPLRESAEPDAGCRYAEASVARVVVEGGTVSAAIQTRSAVDVVLRVSAFPTWQIQIDGAPPSSWRLVAPGFISIRVPPGQHELRATVGPLPHYGLWIVLALLGSIALTMARGRELGSPLALFRSLRLLRR